MAYEPENADGAEHLAELPNTPDETRKKFLLDAKAQLASQMFEVIDLDELDNLKGPEKEDEIAALLRTLISETSVPLNAAETRQIIREITSDVLGLGPLEPLMERADITDIMVIAADQIYIERKGRIENTNLRFRDTVQLVNICIRIANHVGRRVDQTNPICDARLPDGSRVNIVFPPLAVRSPLLTIRKFFKRHVGLKDLIGFGSITSEVASVLAIFASCKGNILISGGTGSGKTTLLNALASEIEESERIVTVEDTLEIQLAQPHVCQLETRPPNIEGLGEITQRDLVKNCLRMRPDRILVGEVRGSEAFDMLQAMNTGHSGSISTLHANSPRDALTRLEDMVALTGFNLPSNNVQKQTASALDLIVQIERLHDGSRKVTSLSEVVGMTDGVITLQELFYYEHLGEDESGNVVGELRSSRLRPKFTERAARYNKDQALIAAVLGQEPGTNDR